MLHHISHIISFIHFFIYLEYFLVIKNAKATNQPKACLFIHLFIFTLTFTHQTPICWNSLPNNTSSPSVRCSVLTVLYYLCDPVHLPEAEQVFGAVAGELFFIWEVSSSLGVYSLFFYYLWIFVFVYVCFPLDLVTAALVSALYAL